MGLKAGIWVSRLKAGGGTEKEEEEEKEEKKEEKFLLCASIGHRPLRGRCPKRKKRKTSHPRIAHGQRYPMPCLE